MFTLAYTQKIEALSSTDIELVVWRDKILEALETLTALDAPAYLELFKATRVYDLIQHKIKHHDKQTPNAHRQIINDTLQGLWLRTGERQNLLSAQYWAKYRVELDAAYQSVGLPVCGPIDLAKIEQAVAKTHLLAGVQAEPTNFDACLLLGSTEKDFSNRLDELLALLQKPNFNCGKHVLMLCSHRPLGLDEVGARQYLNQQGVGVHTEHTMMEEFFERKKAHLALEGNHILAGLTVTYVVSESRVEAGQVLRACTENTLRDYLKLGYHHSKILVISSAPSIAYQTAIVEHVVDAESVVVGPDVNKLVQAYQGLIPEPQSLVPILCMDNVARELYQRDETLKLQLASQVLYKPVRP